MKFKDYYEAMGLNAMRHLRKSNKPIASWRACLTLTSQKIQKGREKFQEVGEAYAVR